MEVRETFFRTTLFIGNHKKEKVNLYNLRSEKAGSIGSAFFFFVFFGNHQLQD